MGSGDSLSFTERWRGAFKPAERDDPRYDALAKKLRILPTGDA